MALWRQEPAISTWRLRSAPEQMAVEHVSKVVDRNEADGWVVTDGSREVLEWFSTRTTPAFALFGRMRQVRIAGAGPDKVAAVSEVTGKLAKLGHRRIVLLVRLRRRLPQPGAVEQAFLDELSAQGLPASDYSVPDWKESGDGFHIRWDRDPLVRSVVGRVSNVSRGKPDQRQVRVPANLVAGGTIGPERQPAFRDPGSRRRWHATKDGHGETGVAGRTAFH